MEKVSPLKAIRIKCLDCCARSPREVNLCQDNDCSLYPFRLGKNPFTKRRGNISNLKFFHKEKPILSTEETQKIGISQGGC